MPANNPLAIRAANDVAHGAFRVAWWWGPCSVEGPASTWKSSCGRSENRADSHFGHCTPTPHHHRHHHHGKELVNFNSYINVLSDAVGYPIKLVEVPLGPCASNLTRAMPPHAGVLRGLHVAGCGIGVHCAVGGGGSRDGRASAMLARPCSWSCVETRLEWPWRAPVCPAMLCAV